MTRTLYTRREFGGLAAAALPVLRHLPGQARPIQIGYCTSLKNVPSAKAAGFDYVELATTEVAALADEDFTVAARTLAATGLPTPVSNLFLPATLKVTGPEANPDAQSTYVARAFERVAQLGVRIVVFGSGGARRVPDGVARGAAFGQLVDFGRRIAPLARARGITVAVEPLRREETNIINSAAEGLELVEAVGDPAFQLMVDFYHLASEHENPDIIVRARGRLRHVHMANPKGRLFPLAWDEFDYQPFFTNLGRIGYAGRISIEASTQDLNTDAPRAIALLRQHTRGN
ncbi:MAG TPA: sugar phosphate isomerase/epimerase family protein [Vicinamibacterales bacterium]